MLTTEVAPIAHFSFARMSTLFSKCIIFASALNKLLLCVLSHIHCASNKLYTCFIIWISVEFFLQRSQRPSPFACQNQKQMHIISQASLYSLCRLHVLGFYIHAWTQRPPIVSYQELVEFENVKCLDKKVQLKDFSICGFWYLLEVREGWSWNQYFSDNKEWLCYKIPNSMMMKTRIE